MKKGPLKHGDLAVACRLRAGERWPLPRYGYGEGLCFLCGAEYPYENEDLEVGAPVLYTCWSCGQELKLTRIDDPADLHLLT